MENKNTSSTTNEGLKEIDKQTNPVMYGWRCPICGRVYSPYVSIPEKPKRTGGGGRTGEARKDEVSLLPLGLHYPYRYSIVTTRTFPIGIRFTSRTKISYYTIIV